MNYLSLPLMCNIADMDPTDNAVDMNQLKFPGITEGTAVRRAALLYIRNTGLQLPLAFDKCSFEEKEEFLLLYMRSNICVDIPVLVCTWLNILLYMRHIDPGLPNILTPDEMHIFVSNNSEFIKDMLRLALSLPIEAMIYLTNNHKCSLNNMGDDPFEIEDYPKSEYNEINFENFVNMTNQSIFIELIEDDMDDIEPTNFVKYFTNTTGRIEWKLHHNLPFISIMELALDTDAAKNKFMEGLEMMLTNQEGENNNA